MLYRVIVKRIPLPLCRGRHEIYQFLFLHTHICALQRFHARVSCAGLAYQLGCFAKTKLNISCYHQFSVSDVLLAPAGLQCVIMDAMLLVGLISTANESVKLPSSIMEFENVTYQQMRIRWNASATQ